MTKYKRVGGNPRATHNIIALKAMDELYLKQGSSEIAEYAAVIPKDHPFGTPRGFVHYAIRYGWYKEKK